MAGTAVAKPYIVQTTTGTYVGEFDTMEQAESSANDRNNRAKALEVTARYEAKAR
jgi:hypothetical protein